MGIGAAVRAQASALRGAWREIVGEFLGSAAGSALLQYLDGRGRAGATIYPPRPLRALELTPFDDVSVVLLGQDPYHGEGQAHGLAFSVPDGVRPPPSLCNIFAELRADLGCAPATGNLECWARQGVLLLNTVFTVEAGAPGSHAGKGWERLSDALIAALARDARPKVFLLWGAYAQAKRPLIDAADAAGGAATPRHLVLCANHPSPLSARRAPVPFFGCRHFSAANAFLRTHGRMPIDWCSAPA